jgi:hypothetical protein
MDTNDTPAAAPPPAALPSARALLRSTLIALGVAALLLVTVVLPAEYGVDPTGVGRALGLKRMGEIKMALAKEAADADAAEAAVRAGGTPATTAAAPVAAPVAAPAAVPAAPPAARSDTVSVTLQPGQGAEYKLAMRKDARAFFVWSVAGGVVNYDLHADRPGLRYHGYEKGQARSSAEGTLVAAFDGMHGWFWRNRGSAPVTVTLRTSGDYQEIKRIE